LIQITDVLAANKLLMSLGADDQMPKLAMTAIERSLELQNRIDRALTYSQHVPPNSTHARQMARILDGSITLDDELNEVQERDVPMEPVPHRLAVEHKPVTRKADKHPRGKLKPGKGLTGRTKNERLAIREWIAENNIDIAPSGRIPQKYLDAYDEFRQKQRNRLLGRNDDQLPMSG
jgi:hypothetical protein